LSYGHQQGKDFRFAAALCKGKAARPWHRARFVLICAAGNHCNPTRVGYRPAHYFMKKIGVMVLTGFSIFFALEVRAQSEDPSEVFLKAYMTSQQGEKLEHDNNFREALAKFRFAGSLLDELRKRHAEWQPAIVEYRSRKIGESILRVEGKVGTQRDLNATAAAPAANISSPPLPEKAGAAEPNVDLVPPPPGQNRVASTVSPPSDAAIQEATKKLRSRVEELEAQLQKSHGDLTAAQKEKEVVSVQLKETNAKLELAQKDAEKTKQTERDLRTQLAQAQDSLGKLQSSGKADTKAQEVLRDEIQQLKKTLASAEAGKALAEKEKDAANLKLADATKQLIGVTQERDTAIAQLQGSKEAQDHVQTLIAENTTLKQKLANAEKTVREIGEDKPKKEQELADVKKQLEQLRQQLAASQKQNQDFEITIADLRSDLDEATAEVEKARLTGANAEETARLTKENDILRGIVIREREEEARRDQARKLMLAEFDKLKIKSDTLAQNIQLLAQPVTKLTNEELALLRQPVVTLSDSNPTAIKASFAVAKRTTTVPVKINNPDAKQDAEESEDLPPAPEPTNTASAAGNNPPGPNVETTFQPGVPKELIPLAREAKENFDRGKYRAAERQYHDLLEKSPNNLYSLSNLGVVLFRTGKLKAAELTLKKAITIAPKDEFSRTTLGIVFYRQSKFDEALTELTKALAINPKSATAHNYLGITASQKGWQEAAEKEMLAAIDVNPDYADAHFNLAVIYATSNPPSKELAKRHYAKATSLGADPDPSLEKLLR
jgi:tetratricopeptide (TPR) repeat protein